MRGVNYPWTLLVIEFRPLVHFCLIGHLIFRSVNNFCRCNGGVKGRTSSSSEELMVKRVQKLYKCDSSYFFNDFDDERQKEEQEVAELKILSDKEGQDSK